MSKFRIPRKKKKQIPKGLYCYAPTSGFKDLGEGRYGFTTKVCPFYGSEKIKDVIQHLKFSQEIFEEIKEEEGEIEAEEYISNRIGFCKAFKCEIDDQCKSCNVKKGW